MGIRQELLWLQWHQTTRRFPGHSAEWLEEPRWQAWDHELLHATALDSGGADLTKVSKRSAARVERYSFDDAPSLVRLVPETPDDDRALTELRERGYTVLPSQLARGRADLLILHLRSPELSLISDDPSLHGRGATTSFTDPLAEKHDKAVSEILSSPKALSLVLDRGVLRSDQDYLGSVPNIETCSSSFSLPLNLPSARAATVFHFDLGRTRRVNIFLVLADVTLGSEAHVFLPGTQRDNAAVVDLRTQGYVRMTDDDVRAAYPEETWTTIRGPRGTDVLEDTRNGHESWPT